MAGKEYSRLFNRSDKNTPKEPWTEETLDQFCRENNLHWYDGEDEYDSPFYKGGDAPVAIITSCGRECGCMCDVVKIRPDEN